MPYFPAPSQPDPNKVQEDQAKLTYMKWQTQALQQDVAEKAMTFARDKKYREDLSKVPEDEQTESLKAQALQKANRDIAGIVGMPEPGKITNAPNVPDATSPMNVIQQQIKETMKLKNIALKDGELKDVNEYELRLHELTRDAIAQDAQMRTAHKQTLNEVGGSMYGIMEQVKQDPRQWAAYKDTVVDLMQRLRPIPGYGEDQIDQKKKADFDKRIEAVKNSPVWNKQVEAILLPTTAAVIGAKQEASQKFKEDIALQNHSFAMQKALMQEQERAQRAQMKEAAGLTDKQRTMEQTKEQDRIAGLFTRSDVIKNSALDLADRMPGLVGVGDNNTAIPFGQGEYTKIATWVGTRAGELVKQGVDPAEAPEKALEEFQQKHVQNHLLTDPTNFFNKVGGNIQRNFSTVNFGENGQFKKIGEEKEITQTATTPKDDSMRNRHVEGGVVNSKQELQNIAVGQTFMHNGKVYKKSGPNQYDEVK